MDILEWNPTATKNKYNTTNWQAWSGGFQCLVYRRAWGWSYTVRAKFKGNRRWLQISAASQEYYADVELAKFAAMVSLIDLMEMTEPILEAQE